MNYVRSSIKRYRADIFIILALTVLTLAVRTPIAAERKIMPAGDAFNFQHIASYIQYGKYPSHEKRLPGYPLFILIGRTAGFDPIQTSIGISIIASTGTIIALYGLGRVFTFTRASLAGFLGLAIFDPLLIMNAIRPLSDGLFVFLVATTLFLTALFLRYPTYATSKMRITYSVIITLLMFTRYEGFLITGLTAPFLFIKLPWKVVAKMAILPICAIILWIPAYRSIHGSVSGLSYVTDATNPGGGFGELSLLPENFGRLMDGAGWKRVWAYPAEVFEEGTTVQSVQRILQSPSWWVGVLSILGLIAMVVVNTAAGTSIILAGLGYALLLAWWWVYSRYVAPLSILFYLGAAGGMTVVTNSIAYLFRKRPAIKMYVASLVPLLLIPILIQEIPALHRSALSRAWESNRKGYALYTAMIETYQKKGIVIYPTKEHANATLYFGTMDEKKSAKNPARGIYLSDWPTHTPELLYDELASRAPRFFIETDFDPRIPGLVAILNNHGNIKETTTYKETRWDTQDIEITNVYELAWP